MLVIIINITYVCVTVFVSFYYLEEKLVINKSLLP